MSNRVSKAVLVCLLLTCFCQPAARSSDYKIQSFESAIKPIDQIPKLGRKKGQIWLYNRSTGAVELLDQNPKLARQRLIKRTGPSELQQAVKLIDKNPKLAEQRLIKLKSPSAKSYLAYLYMSHKVTTLRAKQKIDNLMNTAIAEVTDPFSLGYDCDRSRHYHYTSMTLFLRHLRSINEADHFPVDFPFSMFKEYPEAAFDAFAPKWGSTRDAHLPIEPGDDYDLSKIPSVGALFETLDEMLGSPSATCSGTIRFYNWRTYSLASFQASVAPQIFKWDEKANRHLEKFLETWANMELWNRETYQRLRNEIKAAQLPLSDFYRKRFGFAPSKAASCAKTVLADICLVNLGTYSHSDVDTRLASPVYQTFNHQGLTLQEMQLQLGSREFTKGELSQALRMAILNGANIDVIDWLIKEGAPISGVGKTAEREGLRKVMKKNKDGYGWDRYEWERLLQEQARVPGGTEPPLFTAVLRPEVVQALLKAGADVNETNTIGKTALIQAAQFNALETIKVLLAAGADLNHSMVATDSEEASHANASCDYNYRVGGRTPLMYAAAFSDYPVVMYLLGQGANKNASDSKGATAVKFLNWNTRPSKKDRESLIRALSI